MAHHEKPPQSEKPEGAIPLHLSERERDLILNETLIPDNIMQKMRLALVTDGGLIYRFTLDELDELADYVAEAANHGRNEALENELDRLCDRIEELLGAYAGEEGQKRASDSGLPTFPSSLEKALKEVLDGKSFNPSEELDTQLLKIRTEYNRQPQPEMGGLSPQEVYRLIYSDWGSEGSAIRLNSNLTLIDLKQARMLLNARIFLSAILESGGVKATVKGNLNRKFVAGMFETMHWQPGFVEELWLVNKVLNEIDIFPLHVLRIVLGLAGLLHRAKGLFRTTQKGKKLLDEGKVGALYALLFKTYFMKFNLAYLDRMPETPALQHTIGFSLYMMAKHGNSWKQPADLAPLLLLPAAKEQIPQVELGDYLTWIARHRIMTSLESFGLLEEREAATSGRYAERFEVRKTNLFDAFIRFDL